MILGAAACKTGVGCGRAPGGDGNTAGGKHWAGEESGMEAAAGLHNVLGMGEDPRGMNGAGRSRPEPKRSRARTSVGSLEDSGMLTAHTGMVAMDCVCSMNPSWVELLSGGGDVVQRGVRTNASPTRSRLAWAQDSVPEGTRAGEDWAEGASDSRPGSWNVQTAAGVGGEEVADKEDVSGALRVEVDRERSSARVLC